MPVMKPHGCFIFQAGIAAEPYHAGLKVAERKRVQEEWTNGTVQVASKYYTIFSVLHSSVNV